LEVLLESTTWLTVLSDIAGVSNDTNNLAGRGWGVLVLNRLDIVEGLVELDECEIRLNALGLVPLVRGGDALARAEFDFRVVDIPTARVAKVHLDFVEAAQLIAAIEGAVACCCEEVITDEEASRNSPVLAALALVMKEELDDCYRDVRYRSSDMRKDLQRYLPSGRISFLVTGVRLSS
jgi:hypothetical protein